MLGAGHALAGLAAAHRWRAAHEGGEAGAGEAARRVAAARVGAANVGALKALVDVVA